MIQELTGITSVLIPLYNHAPFLEKTLDSLLSSDCSKIELIICDDASPDHSYRIAAEWLERHANQFMQARLIANEKNLGVTANLNKLAKAATGEFITFVASDDILADKAIDKQKDYLMSHQSIDFVFADCSIINLEGHILKKNVVSSFQSKLFAIRPYILLNVMFNWSVIWARLFARRRKFIDFGPYIEEHSIEDRWSAIKIMNTHRYAYFHEVVLLYRFRGLEGHPAIDSAVARRDFHNIERRLHLESTGFLSLLLWIRRLPFKTNHGKWPCRLSI
jgi:glycosyltransferase involved in cell wall biosynthesis